MGFKIHSTSNHKTPPLVEAPCSVTPEVGLILSSTGAIGAEEPFYVCMQSGAAVNGKVLAVRITPEITFEAIVSSDPQKNVGQTVGVDAAGTGIASGEVCTCVAALTGDQILQDEPVLVVFK